MTQDEFLQFAKECTQWIPDHQRRDARQRLQEIVDSPLCDERPDHYGRGGFVNTLEAEVATLLGKEAAVFMPSGTMAQPIALRIWSDRAKNKTVAFHPTCHLQLHEHMGYETLHGLKAVLLGTAERMFTLKDLKAVKRQLSSVLIELPQREIGGQLPAWDDLCEITAEAKRKGAKLHLDGARLWECQPYYNRPYSEIVADFDSVYVSFYKVLGGLPGAILAGPADFIEEARIWMRRQGGNLYQMYPNAISAKNGLDRHLHRIPEYVAKAREVAKILSKLPGITVEPSEPPTNMMHLYFDAPVEVVMEASGIIARDEKCYILGRVGQTERGSKCELWVGETALEITPERLRFLLTKFGRLVGPGG